jgi:hypothetical protein
MAKVIQLPRARGDAELALDVEQIMGDAATELAELAADAGRYSPASFKVEVAAIVQAVISLATARVNA